MKQLAFTALVAVFATLAVGCSPASNFNNSKSQNNTAIIGGTDVSEGSALEQSIVGIYDMKKGALCTGSLVRDNVVLTAAHCIGDNPQDHLIVFAADLIGTFKKGQSDKNYLLQHVRRGEKTVVNSGWGQKHSGSDAWSDLALIKFTGTAPQGFKPATFISSSGLLKKGATVTVAGYGVNSDVLTQVDQNTPDFQDKLKSGEYFCDDTDMSKAKCYKEDVTGEGQLRTTQLAIEGNLNNTEVILNQEHGHASCEGDSGGPAYLQINGQYQLWGVTSRGTRGCNGYVVYTDAVAQSQWVNDNITQITK